MEIITIGFILIINIVAIIIFYKSLGEIDVKSKIIILLAGVILMYTLLYIIYSISSSGIEAKVAQASKQILIFTFLPINIMCTITPIMVQFKKLKQEDINNDKFKKKVILYTLIGVLILIIECIYIKDIQRGIEKFKVVSMNAK